MKCRCKFQVQSVTHFYRDKKDPTVFMRSVKMTAVYDDGLSKENAGFSKATPSGTLEFSWDNPNVNFEVGQYLYLDLISAEE